MTGYSQSDPVRNEKGCWYKFDVDYCPVCADTTIEKTRMPSPKPENWEDRYEQTEYACMGHFM